MADKELRKMNRSELIEIIYVYQQNEKTLLKENKKLKLRLKDRMLKMEEAGSIADAAMELNKVFASAQQAADDYLASAISLANKQADEIVEEAQKKARQMMEEAQNEIAEKQQHFHEMLQKLREENPELAEKWMAMTTVEAQN